MSDDAFTPGRPVHFEIHAADAARALAFYTSVFGWETEDWSEYAGMPYFGLSTGEGPGIDGAIMRRDAGMPPVINTIDVDSVDDAVGRVEANGGKVAMPKMAVPGVGYLAYCVDTEGNMFGMMQRDEAAG